MSDGAAWHDLAPAHGHDYSPSGHTHDRSTMTAMRNAVANLSGGGSIFVEASHVRWTQRFITIAVGRGAHWSVGGHYDLNVPAAGTVIPAYPDPNQQGVTSFTITTAGYFPLTAWWSLWAIPTIGGVYNAISYAYVWYNSDFVVPDHWIFVAVRSGDDGRVRFGNGETYDYWRDFAFQNNWTPYPASTHHPQYRKNENGYVIMRGLVRNGTAASLAPSIFSNMPAGYRPVVHTYWIGDGYSGGYVPCHLHMNVNGNISISQPSIASGGYFSLDNVHFTAEA